MRQKSSLSTSLLMSSSIDAFAFAARILVARARHLSHFLHCEHFGIGILSIEA